MSDYTNEQLILKFQKGDIKSFNEIVERFKDKLLNFINGYMHDYETSQNLLQDTFMKVYTHGDSYKEISKFSTWIYTISGNLARTELRKIKRRKTYTFSSLSTQDREFIVESPESNTVEENTQTFNKNIQIALSNLPDEMRTIIILRDIQELSYEEISKIIDLPLGTVKSRINRGRIKLKELLKI